MRAFVITIKDNPKSVEMADRCIKSFLRHNGDSIEQFDAITPEKQCFSLAHKKGIPVKNFLEKYSRYENCVSAFLSHYSLLEKCIELNEPIIIFEHDAVVKAPIPKMPFNGLVNIGKPSYGKYLMPGLGLGKLVSKQYLPGAHAYAITPRGAQAIIEESVMNARPTDVYLNNRLFPWLEEYYPWPVECDDSFTTIQNETGCLAKHNYGEGYDII
jgi:glycosyl transferase family 25